MDAFVAQVEAAATSRVVAKLNEQIKWLQALGTNAERFAACFVWATCTSGVKSTQRAEAMQRVAKHVIGLGTRTTLLEMVEAPVHLRWYP